MFSCFLEVAGLGLQNMLRVLLTYQHGYQQMTNSIFSIQKKHNEHKYNYWSIAEIKLSVVI